MSPEVPGVIGAEQFDRLIGIILYNCTYMKNTVFVIKPNSEFKVLENLVLYSNFPLKVMIYVILKIP